MVRQEAIQERWLWVKWGVLLVVWVLSAVVFITIVGNNELSKYCREAASPGFDLQLPQNELRAFHYRSMNSKDDNRPVFSVRFQSLCAENSNLGFFKTALHKVIKIQDLELNFHQYSQGKATSSTVPGIQDASEAISIDIAVLIKNTIQGFTTPVSGWRFTNIDIGNVSEVRVNNFDCRVFRDNNLRFATQSRRAIVSYKDSDVILHGSAKITIADGSTLESNEIKWDVKRQYFSVRGVYVLNRRGIITTGKGICVDAQLKSIEGQYAQSKRKEQKCIARF